MNQLNNRWGITGWSWKRTSGQWSGRVLGIIGWDPSVCKSNQLHVDIHRFSFIKLGYILLQIPLKRWVIFLQSWTSTGYFSNSTSSSVTNCRFSPIIASGKLPIVLERILENTPRYLVIEKGERCQHVTDRSWTQLENTRTSTDWLSYAPTKISLDTGHGWDLKTKIACPINPIRRTNQ